MVRGSRTDLKELFSVKKAEIIRPTAKSVYWNKRRDAGSFPNLSMCLRGLCGQIKQGLGLFPSLPYCCPASEVSAELSAAAARSHMSLKWLKTWLFLPSVPQK